MNIDGDCIMHNWRGEGCCPYCNNMSEGLRLTSVGIVAKSAQPGETHFQKLVARNDALGKRLDQRHPNIMFNTDLSARQSLDPLAPNYWPERLEHETMPEYGTRVRKLRQLLQPAKSMYNVETVETLVSQLKPEEREDYVCALREIVKGPSVGGYGQYLGSLVPLVFATKEQKLQAVMLMERWSWDSENK